MHRMALIPDFSHCVYSVVRFNKSDSSDIESPTSETDFFEETVSDKVRLLPCSFVNIKRSYGAPHTQGLC
jgi:hypothetical protein